MLYCAAMKKMFIYKAIAFATIFATLGVVPARAQDDEVTSIDDFLEESAPESATVDGKTNSAVAQSGTV